jgi:cytoskeleton protein RodZ
MNNDVPENEAMSNEVTEPAQETVQEQENLEPVISAGVQLATLRQERGWTVEQVASQLNLAARQIQALEDDNYAALPGMVIVRGFIRSYSKVLRVDPAPILAAIKEDAATVVPSVLPPERSPLSASFSETKLLTSGQRGVSPKTIIGGSLLVAAALLAYAGQHMGWWSHGVSGSAAKVEEKLAPIELAQEPVETVTEVPAPEEVVEAKPAEVKPAEAKATETKPAEVSKPTNEPAVAATPAAPTTAPVVAKSAPVAAAPKPAALVDGKNALVISVREDSWVEIKGADNNILLSRLLKAGTAEAVPVTAPVSVVIGNAAGVDVTLRGAPVDVVSGNSSNVARLNLK